MKLTQTNLKIISTIAGGIIAALIIPASAQAAGVEIYLTPDKTSVKQDETFKMQARIKAEGVSVKQAYVSIEWPEHSLEFDGFSKEGSEFAKGCPDGLTGNFRTAYICSYHEEGLTGDLLLGTYTFKALKYSGSINVEVIRKTPTFSTEIYTDRYYPEYITKNSRINFLPQPTPSPGAKENGSLPEATAETQSTKSEDTNSSSSDVGNTGVSPYLESNVSIDAKVANNKTNPWVIITIALIAGALAIWFYKFRHGKKLVAAPTNVTSKSTKSNKSPTKKPKPTQPVSNHRGRSKLS